MIISKYLFVNCAELIYYCTIEETISSGINSENLELLIHHHLTDK